MVSFANVVGISPLKLFELRILYENQTNRGLSFDNTKTKIKLIRIFLHLLNVW